jgi:hypothetical protein
MTRSWIVRSIYCFGFILVLCQAVALAQTSVTPQAAGAAIVPAWPDGPGIELTGIPYSETFVILGAGGERELTGGGNNLPTRSRYIATGTVEGYVETDSLDVSNVDYLGSAGTLTMNGTSVGIAPTVSNAASSVTAFAVTPTSNATYQLTGETQTCYLLPLSGGEVPPPPEQPPCGDDCGDPGDPDSGPEAVSSQITLTPIASFAEGSGYPPSDGGCYAFKVPPITVTFTGIPHITSISKQSANVNSSGTFTVTGTNLEDSEGVSVPNFSTTITSSLSGSPGQSSENVSFSVPSTQAPGNYGFTISNMWGTSNAVSFGVPYSPVTVTGISPSLWTAGQSYQAVQITGTNFGSTPTVTLSDPTITVSAPYNTSSASPTSGASTTYVNLSVPATTPSEPVVVKVTPGSFGSSFVQVPGGPSLPGSNTAAVIGLQQSACPDMLDGSSGFSSIASSGAGIVGNGTMTVSFSGGSFVGNVTAPYGQYSTPESIASHLAALITQRYSRSGLSAESYGAYILYRSSGTLGAANFTSSDASFTTNPSPQSCPPINPNLRLVPVYSQDEAVSGGLTILHNVWRLVTLAGGKATLDYGVVEHIPYNRHGTVPDGQGGYQSPANSAITDSPYNIFNDGIGCLTQANCPSPPPGYSQKFTITQINGLNPGGTTPVWTRINGQDHLINTIYEHGINAPTYNNPNPNSGPLPQYSPDPYINDTFICYLCTQ